MKITSDPFLGFIEVDVQTRHVGGTAVNVAGDESMDVYYGPLHASVTLRDLGVRVTMDPIDGNWRDVGWARQKALEVLRDPEHFQEILVALITLHRHAGEAAGRDKLQSELAALLGI